MSWLQNINKINDFDIFIKKFKDLVNVWFSSVIKLDAIEDTSLTLPLENFKVVLFLLGTVAIAEKRIVVGFQGTQWGELSELEPSLLEHHKCSTSSSSLEELSSGSLKVVMVKVGKGDEKRRVVSHGKWHKEYSNRWQKEGEYV